MTTHLYIITGSSRGLGHALALQLLQPGHQLLCMARQRSDALAEAAERAGVPLEQWTLDLADPAPAAARLGTWLRLHRAQFTGATLINNAARLAPIAPMAQAPGEEIAAALRIGLEAPMLLTARFLRETERLTGPRRVLNISSGLGRRPMAAQATYCALKAGLDHFSRCLALEEAAKPNGARVCALAPGVIDTGMQVQMRGADPAQFPDIERFRTLAREGRLQTPEATAEAVLRYLARADFGHEVIADVRDH